MLAFLWEDVAAFRPQTVTTALQRVLCFCAAFLLSIVLTLGLSFDSYAQNPPVVPKADLIQGGSDATPEDDPNTVDVFKQSELKTTAIVGIEGAVLKSVIKIQDQPFYNELQQLALFWDDSPIGHVEDRAPRETLLNFYAVMASVGSEIESIRRDAKQDPGFGWTPEMKERIHDVDVLFGLAIKALNGSDFPESVRGDLVDEAAIQLKLVLDYVFSSRRRPIVIPDEQAVRLMNQGLAKRDEFTWRLPGTGIVLASDAEQEGNDWYFSPSTVAGAAKMYKEIEADAEKLQGVPFATPDFYRNFIRTPWHLVPPKWYLNLPDWIHEFIEVDIFAGQTTFQLLFAFLAFVLYAIVVLLLISRLITSHVYRAAALTKISAEERLAGVWNEDEIAWQRVLFVLPILPLTTISKVFVDDYLNFTGTPLVFATYFFYVAWCLSACLLGFYFFEALGKSGAETLLRVRGSQSSIKLKRWGSRVQPVCRALSGIVALFLLYRMLIQLGLPGSLVLALSSVPGLAIALGASKLLSNLFAGFSIQTDRPLRVGEFCRIGEYLGYVTKIGLRSIEIQTVTSTVAIPNSIADDSIIVNYSDRQLIAGNEHRQGVEIRVPISISLTAAQVNQLLFFINRYLEGLEELSGTRVNIEQDKGDELTIVGFGYGDFLAWNDYLETRKKMFVRFKQIIAQILMSRIVLRVAYQTPETVRRRIPEQLQQIVCLDEQITFGSCELLKISDYSYDFIFDFRAFHPTYGGFLKAVDRINQDLLAYVERENIVMPFPTSIFIQKPADLHDLRGVNPM